jgi:hypothetical protein
MTEKKKTLPPNDDEENQEECVPDFDGVTGSTLPLEYIDVIQQDPWPKIVGRRGYVLSAEAAIQERELTLAFVDGSVAAVVIPSAGSTQH